MEVVRLARALLSLGPFPARRQHVLERVLDTIGGEIRVYRLVHAVCELGIPPMHGDLYRLCAQQEAYSFVRRPRPHRLLRVSLPEHVLQLGRSPLEPREHFGE